jgi:recombinational DNA repair ATPase RecF
MDGIFAVPCVVKTRVISMNFLVGDNGLGKSFLLDAAWWALTRTWARHPLAPKRQTIRVHGHKVIRSENPNPQIAYRYTKRPEGHTPAHKQIRSRDSVVAAASG